MFALLRDGRAAALLLAATLTILSNTLISPALPGIEAAFRGQPDAALLVRFLATVPSLVVAILAPFASAMADRFGRRPQLLVGVAIFAVAGTAGLWLPSLTAILASRLLLGAAVGLVRTAQTALIGDHFACDTRTRFMGLQIACTNFGGLMFFLVSGWLVDREASLIAASNLSTSKIGSTPESLESRLRHSPNASRSSCAERDACGSVCD